MREKIKKLLKINTEISPFLLLNYPTLLNYPNLAELPHITELPNFNLLEGENF
jgi:hypothetical protein